MALLGSELSITTMTSFIESHLETVVDLIIRIRGEVSQMSVDTP